MQYHIALTGLTLNLENLENRPFMRKIREKPGFVLEFFIYFLSKSGKCPGKSGKADYLVRIKFSLAISMVVRELII